MFWTLSIPGENIWTEHYILSLVRQHLIQPSTSINKVRFPLSRIVRDGNSQVTENTEHTNPAAQRQKPRVFAACFTGFQLLGRLLAGLQRQPHKKPHWTNLLKQKGSQNIKYSTLSPFIPPTTAAITRSMAFKSCGARVLASICKLWLWWLLSTLPAPPKPASQHPTFQEHCISSGSKQSWQSLSKWISSGPEISVWITCYLNNVPMENKTVVKIK